MAADTYVISIYRRNSKAGEKITGLAERTGSGERKAFASSGELWAFLSAMPASQKKRTKKKQGTQK